MPQRHWLGALAVIATLSLMGNVYFITRPLPPAPQSLQRPVLPPGSDIRDLRGLNEAGEGAHVQLAGSSRPTVLYVVTPSCVWCTRNQENFTKLAVERSGQYRFVLVSLTRDGFREYLAPLKAKWGDADIQVLAGLSREDRDRLMLGSTPQTMVIGTDGRLLRNWVGAYTDNTLVGVENFFLLQMPGLSERE